MIRYSNLCSTEPLFLTAVTDLISDMRNHGYPPRLLHRRVRSTLRSLMFLYGKPSHTIFTGLEATGIFTSQSFRPSAPSS